MLRTGVVHQFVVSNVFQSVVGVTGNTSMGNVRMGDVTIVLVWTDVAGLPSAYTVFLSVVLLGAFFNLACVRACVRACVSASSLSLALCVSCALFLPPFLPLSSPSPSPTLSLSFPLSLYPSPTHSPQALVNDLDLNVSIVQVCVCVCMYFIFCACMSV